MFNQNKVEARQMIIHQIAGIVKKMFANLKEIGGSIEAMCPAMEAGPAGVRASVLAVASLAGTGCRGKPEAAKIISLFSCKNGSPASRAAVLISSNFAF